MGKGGQHEFSKTRRVDPTVATEIAKTRPALIISNDVGNQYSSRVIVAPISTGGQSKIYPFEVGLKAGEGGLSQRSKVLLIPSDPPKSPQILGGFYNLGSQSIIVEYLPHDVGIYIN